MVSRDAFLEALQVSRATFKRDLEYLRDRMDAPILWDPEAGGYRLASEDGAQQNYELPGLWLSAGEIYALLAIPFTRLSHMLFSPFTRAYMGSEFGKVRMARDW